MNASPLATTAYVDGSVAQDARIITLPPLWTTLIWRALILIWRQL